jgi:hypothetical protein
MPEFLQSTERRKFPTIEEGPMWWSDTARANCILRLKRKIAEEYPILRENKKIGYRIEIWKSFDEIKKRIDDIEKSNEALPMLFFIYEHG